MNFRDRRARDIQQQIREILLREWDPIGVRDVPKASDEYDAYIGGVYRLLASGADPQTIAEHLARIETDAMGFSASADKLLPVAMTLAALEVRLAPTKGPA